MSLSPANIAYLIMVVTGFALFAVVLFSVWTWTNWSIWVPRTAAKPRAAAKVEAKAPDYSKVA